MNRDFISKSSAILGIILLVVGFLSKHPIVHGGGVAMGAVFLGMSLIFKLLKNEQTDEDLHALNQSNPKGFTARTREVQDAKKRH